MINGIIHDVLNNKVTKPINITVLDYRQCFDSMWLEEAMNDLFEAGLDDDKIAVIYEANKTNQVAINTPSGLTERKIISQIVLQGDVFGPLECTVQVDSFGKECLQQDKLLYNYKNSVGVPLLGMVDDVLCVSDCGVDTVLLNAFMRAKTNIKKLQYGVEKCHKIHVGRKSSCCPVLKIDEWEVKDITEIDTGKVKYEDS